MLLGVMASAGCSSQGTYVLNLKFGTVEGPSEDVTPYGCGFHGVAAWYLTESGNDAGVYPCGKSTITRSTKPGSYQIIVRALDTEGNDTSDLPYLIAPLLPGAWPDVKVEEGKTNTVADPLYIEPLPQCADGVDNDCDGRVDLQDPACTRAPSSVSCSSDADCTVPGFSYCNKTFGACLSSGPELGADDAVGSGCLNMKKDGGAPAPDGAGGQGGSEQDGGAGGQGGAGGAAGASGAGGTSGVGGEAGGAPGEIATGGGGQGGTSTGSAGAGGA